MCDCVLRSSMQQAQAAVLSQILAIGYCVTVYVFCGT
jgi:hypothetical protein